MNSPVLLARELRWQTRLHLAGSLNRPVKKRPFVIYSFRST